MGGDGPRPAEIDQQGRLVDAVAEMEADPPAFPPHDLGDQADRILRKVT